MRGGIATDRGGFSLKEELLPRGCWAGGKAACRVGTEQVSFPLAPIIGDGAVGNTHDRQIFVVQQTATRQFRRITKSTITTSDGTEIYRSCGDAAGPQVLKSRLHKFTDEENRMQPIAAEDVATALAAVAVGTAGEPHRGVGWP